MLSPIRAVLTPVLHALVVVIFAAYAHSALAADPLTASGVAMIPEDAAFVSATLRAREQYDRFEKSNAFAALKKLPFVARGVDSIEEQKLQPGSPLSIMSTFMELPENEQALDLLKDMVSTDTFVYGEPSCVKFVELMKKIQQAQNAAGMLRLASGDASVGGFEVDMLDGINVEEMDEDDEDDDQDDEDEKGATDMQRRLRAKPVRFQATDADLGRRTCHAAGSQDALREHQPDRGARRGLGLQDHQTRCRRVAVEADRSAHQARHPG
jgi:hypothetical protein